MVVQTAQECSINIVMACATKDSQCWLEADYERTVSVMLCLQRICSARIRVDTSRML
jgi:hypothetical protein